MGVLDMSAGTSKELDRDLRDNGISDDGGTITFARFFTSIREEEEGSFGSDSIRFVIGGCGGGMEILRVRAPTPPPL